MKAEETIDRYGEHIAISVTNSCPLQCKHCISGSAPDTMRADPNIFSAFEDFLNIWPRIKHITLTGGEPFHHTEDLLKLSKICKLKNIKYGAITGAFWAKSQKSCDHYLAHVPELSSLTISTDIYHLEFITLRHVMNAVKACRKRKIPVRVRFTHEKKMSKAENAIRSDLEVLLKKKELEYAPMQMYGRAKIGDIGLKYDRWNNDYNTKYGNCPSTGPHIFEDGRITPCCNTIVSIRDYKHPLVFGNIIKDGAEDVYNQYIQNALFSTIKVLGFDWLKTEMINKSDKYKLYSPVNACDFCFDICDSDQIRNDVLEIVSNPKVSLYVQSIIAYHFESDEAMKHLSELAALLKRKNACSC